MFESLLSKLYWQRNKNIGGAMLFIDMNWGVIMADDDSVDDFTDGIPQGESEEE